MKKEQKVDKEISNIKKQNSTHLGLVWVGGRTYTVGGS